MRGVGFRGPENLVYDSAADVYYVANVNGSPTARDGNGYISRVAADGRVLDLAWIRGGRGGATLDGPMGLAIRGVTPWPGGRALVTTFGDSVLERVGPVDSSMMIILGLPGGRVDGLRPAPGGGWFVTSWGAHAVWRWRVGAPLVPVLGGVTSPAGGAVDTRRGRLAVTSMQDNALYLVPLPPATRR